MQEIKITASEFQGRITLRVHLAGESIKLELHHLEDMLSSLWERGALYTEVLGNDRLKTLLLDK